MNLKAATTVLALGLLAACRVGPHYVPPPAPPGADEGFQSLRDPLATAAATPEAWWRLYRDARLDALVQESLQANQDLAAAQSNFAAARAVVAGAKSARSPSTKATVGGIYGRDAVTDEILELGGHPPQTIWLLEDVFEVAYEVDLFGRVSRSIEAARANAAAVAAARDSLKVVIVAATARAYAEICALGEQLAVANRSLDIVSHESQITENRHEAGANSALDVARAQALVAQVRASISPLEGQRRAALFELAALLGRPPARAPHEVESCVTPPALTALIPAGDGVQLLKRRPDVRQAERRLAAATAQTGVATAELYPVIRLGGFVGSVGTQVSDLTNNVGLTWGIGPSISWDFPNQLAARARLRQARSNQVSALANFDSVVLTALKEVEQSLSLYGAALDNHHALVEAQEKIHSAFDMAHDQFLAGSLSNLDLLTTEQSLVSTDAALAASDAGLIRDQIAVFKALGGGWRMVPPPGAQVDGN